MITYYYRSLKQKSLKQIDSHRKGALSIVTNATPEDLEAVADNTGGLEVDDLKDIFDFQEIPRLEKFDSGFLMVLREPTLNTAHLHTGVVMVVVTKTHFSVFVASTSPTLAAWLKKPHITTQSTKLLLSFLIAISEQYRLQINTLQRQVFEVKQHIHQAANADIQKLIEYENILDEYLAALVPMKQIYTAIVSGKVVTLFEEDADLFEDALNSVTQSATVCDTNLKSIEGLRDAFQIMFTNKLNETVKFLTSATIILTIPTMVASIYGMNIALPLSDHPVAFPIVIGIALSVSLFITLVFRKLHWL